MASESSAIPPHHRALALILNRTQNRKLWRIRNPAARILSLNCAWPREVSLSMRLPSLFPDLIPSFDLPALQ